MEGRGYNQLFDCERHTRRAFISQGRFRNWNLTEGAFFFLKDSALPS